MTQVADFKVEGNFPAFITSAIPITFQQLLEVLKKNKLYFEKLLLKHGALVFRGFPIQEAKDFSNFISALNLGKCIDYIGGDSPRHKVIDQVYTSTEAPPDFYIPLHQELSYIKNFPRHIYFFCEIEPLIGGATVIADARRISRALRSDIKNRFKEKGLTYTSHYYHQSKIMSLIKQLQRSHKSWIDVFETQHKNEVEKKCIENEFAWKWLRNNWLEVKQTRPALLDHPLTNETVWFNQAHLYDFNPRLLGWKKYIGAKLFYINPSTRLHEIHFSDGSKISRKDLYHILDVLQENTVSFPWKRGDVMVIDNILGMHGREPFQGKRRILAAMTS